MKLIAVLLVAFLFCKHSYAQNTYTGIVLDFITREPAPFFLLDFYSTPPIYQKAEKNGLFEFTDNADSLIFTETLSVVRKSITLYPGKFDTLFVDYEGFKQALKSATVCVPSITPSSVNTNKEEVIMDTRNQNTNTQKNIRHKKKNQKP